MKVKNVSKKVIGNRSFRLLPGESMLVTGDEVWVKNYLDNKKLEIIADQEASVAAAGAGEVGNNQENTETVESESEKSAEPGGSEQKKTAGRPKKSQD